jgi:hypothetical protein
MVSSLSSCQQAGQHVTCLQCSVNYLSAEMTMKHTEEAASLH